MPFRAVLAALLLAAAIPASATPQARNATDIWFNAAESGWGLNVIHQGDTLFATLFVYGPDGQPKWYVASGLAGDGSTFSGALHETSGPWFGGAFDPASVQRRQVGTMALAVGDGAAGLDFTVDGVRVTKQVVRYTFRRSTVQGTYEGAMLQPASGGSPESGKTDLSLLVTDDGSSFLMDSSSDSQSPCTWTGTPSQDGQLEAVAGTYRCAGGTRSGAWSMRVDPAPAGFTGTFQGDGVTGRIYGARRTATRRQGTGWRNDMWFLPSEDGWGLNIIEQGDVLFATLFVYDAQRRPRWYTAELLQSGDAADGSVPYAGAVTESTGPFFGTAFNPAAVTRRTVGQATFRTRGDGRADFSYSVDGIQVTRVVQRYAFRKQDFTGDYLGSWAHDRQASFTIDDGADFRMRMVDRFGGKGTCDFAAPFFQSGSVRTMSGTFTCAGGRSGTFVMRDATVAAAGFTATFESAAFDAFLGEGHVGGARR